MIHVLYWQKFYAAPMVIMIQFALEEEENQFGGNLLKMNLNPNCFSMRGPLLSTLSTTNKVHVDDDDGPLVREISWES